MAQVDLAGSFERLRRESEGAAAQHDICRSY